jgi:hypothetical protein
MARVSGSPHALRTVGTGVVTDAVGSSGPRATFLGSVGVSSWLAGPTWWLYRTGRFHDGSGE